MALVTLSLLGGAGWQFFDSNGNPLAGGLLYTYEAGTSTPATTYTSVAGNIAHSNPIVLDAAGRVPEEIWITGASYKFVLKTSQDVLVWTKDNIAINAGTLIYNEGQTGAVDRTISSKLQEWISVKDFGAKGDGITDDYSAFVAAQAAADYLLVPPGTYILGSSISLTKNFKFLKNSILKPAASMTITFTQGGLECGLYKIFDLSNAGTSVLFGLRSGAPSWIDDGVRAPTIWAEWFGLTPNDSTTGTGTINTTALTNALNSTIAGKVSIGFGNFYFNGPVSPTGMINGIIEGQGKYATNLYAINSTDKILNLGAYDLSITGLTFYNGLNHIYFDTNNSDAANVVITNCTFRNPSASAIETSTDSNSTLLTIRDCVYMSNSGAKAGSQFVKSYTDYTYVKDCWASSDADNVFEARGAEMTIDSLVGVSASPGTVKTWVTSYASNIKLLRNRFGADGGGWRTVLINNATSALTNEVIVEDNFIGQDNTIPYPPDYIFNTLPQNLTFRNNRYYSSGGLVRVNTIPDYGYFKPGLFVNEGGFVGYWTGSGSGTYDSVNVETERWYEQNLRINPQMADIALQSPPNTFMFYSGQSANITQATGAYQFLGGPTVTKLTATAGNAYINYDRNDIGSLGILTANTQYTFICDFYVVGSGTANVKMVAYNSRIDVTLTPGLNVINLPFFTNPNPTEPCNVIISGVSNGLEIYWGRVRFLRGRYQINTPNTYIMDASSATASTSVNTSDVWEYTDPASGGYIGKVYTPTGWKTFGAIS